MSGWPTANLGEVCNVRRGSVITKKKANPGDVPVIAGGIGPAYFHDTPNRDGDVITVSGSGANAGFVNFFGRPIWASDCSTIQPNGDALDVRYVYLFLLNMQQFINENLRQGAAQPHVYPKDLAKLEIPLPPLEEQKRIVAVLDQAFAALDRARANAEANLVDAEELRSTSLRNILDHVKAGFDQTTIGASCEFYNGKAHEKDIDAGGSFVVVNSKFISTEGEVRKYTNKQMFPLEVADIAMVMSDVPGGKALAKCYVIETDGLYSLNQRICCLRSDHFDTNFLYHQLNRNPYLLAFDDKGSQANLRKAEILSCPISVPPRKKQEEIASLMDELNDSCRNLAVTLERKKQDLEDLRQSILQKAFAGELT